MRYTRQYLIKNLKNSDSFTREQKNELNKIFLKSLTYGPKKLALNKNKK